MVRSSLSTWCWTAEDRGSLTIVHNDGNDLDPDVGVIDFVQGAVGGVFQAEGRVAQDTGILGSSVTLAATPPGTEAVLRNVGASAATFTVTIHSSTFTSTGSPLGWAIYYTATADDPTPDDVEITSSSVALAVNGSATPLGTLALDDISPPVAPVDQPVTGSDLLRGVDTSGQASSAEVTFTFTAGPGDRLVLGPNEFDRYALEGFVFNQENRCITKITDRLTALANKCGAWTTSA